MTKQSPSLPLTIAFELLCAQYAQRLPVQLEDLNGPARSSVDLPLHRSGRAAVPTDWTSRAPG